MSLWGAQEGGWWDPLLDDQVDTWLFYQVIHKFLAVSSQAGQFPWREKHDPLILRFF